MGLRLGALRGQLHGPPCRSHGGIGILRFLEGLGQPQVGLGALGDLSQHAPVEGRRRLGIGAAAPDLEGAGLEHEGPDILRGGGSRCEERHEQ